VSALAVGALWALLSGWWTAEQARRGAVRFRSAEPELAERRGAERRALGRGARLAAVAGIAASLAVLHPVLVPTTLVAAVGFPRLRARRALQHAEAAVVDELPDVVDLLSLTTAAGLPVGAAIRAIGGRPGGRLGPALAAATASLAHGAATSDALAALADRGGPAIRRLVDALADHDRYGTPLGPVLDRVSVESRLARRRQAEQAAHRLPVSLLFPLVLTVLPAFVLLVVIPLLAGSLAALEL
jgi:tight adherence protein C